tara:strand:+ start:1660 stop:2217 length:558 start_codon:yes stop_codon:yes gene_type:complete
MPKTTRRKRGKKSKAWEELLKRHRKGPKRVQLQNPRFKNGVDPLYRRENVKRVQIILNTEHDPKYISVVMFNQSFVNIGLHDGDDISMPVNKLRKAGHALRKTFDVFDHNDRVLDAVMEKKLGGLVGRCILFTKKFEKCNATIHIMPTEEEIKKKEAVRKHIDNLFENTSNRGMCAKEDRDIEYI